MEAAAAAAATRGQQATGAAQHPADRGAAPTYAWGGVAAGICRNTAVTQELLLGAAAVAAARGGRCGDAWAVSRGGSTRVERPRYCGARCGPR